MWTIPANRPWWGVTNWLAGIGLAAFFVQDLRCIVYLNMNLRTTGFTWFHYVSTLIVCTCFFYSMDWFKGTFTGLSPMIFMGNQWFPVKIFPPIHWFTDSFYNFPQFFLATVDGLSINSMVIFHGELLVRNADGFYGMVLLGSSGHPPSCWGKRLFRRKKNCQTPMRPYPLRRLESSRRGVVESSNGNPGFGKKPWFMTIRG